MGVAHEYNLLVVSDLHLSEGRRAGSKRFPPNEDFFFDAEFARFLAHYQGPGGLGARWHLVIAGDFLDFLQVVSAPSPQADDGYGLPCGPQESVYKLGVVARGHPEVFAALAGFVAAGHRLTILKGNHDPEFHYEVVQAELIRLLAAAFQASPPRAPSATAANIGPGNVRFGDWFHHEEGLLWIEHGNQYEGWNAFRTFLSPLMPLRRGWSRPDDIDLPLGSLFVRYLFNRIEAVEPFADNVKPTKRFVGWLLKRHPITALEFLYTDGLHMVGRIRRAMTRGVYAQRDREHQLRLDALATASGIPVAKLQAIDELRAKNVLEEPTGVLPHLIRALIELRVAVALVTAFVVAITVTGVLAAVQLAATLVPALGTALHGLDGARWGVGWVVRTGLPLAAAIALAVLAGLGLWWALRPEAKPPRDYLLAKANRIAAELDVRYVVMGHTHDAQLCALDRGGEYFNTGTWTKVFSDEERLIRDDVEFVFLQGVRDGKDLKLRLMQWDDGAGEPRLLKLFEG